MQLKPWAAYSRNPREPDDAVEPPCVDGRPCGCELCTCQIHDVELIWSDTINDVYCPECAAKDACED